MESSTRARVIWFTKHDFQRWTALSTYGSVCRHTLKHIPTCFYFTPQPTSVTHTCYLHVCVCLCVRVFERRNSSAGNVTLVPRIAVSLKLWDENSSTALLSSPSNSLPHVLSSHFKTFLLSFSRFLCSLSPSFTFMLRLQSSSWAALYLVSVTISQINWSWLPYLVFKSLHDRWLCNSALELEAFLFIYFLIWQLQRLEAALLHFEPKCFWEHSVLNITRSWLPFF